MITATASAKLIDPVLQLARHLQQDPQELLQQIGIAAQAIDHAGARIPAERFSALLQALAVNTGNPRIALRAGEATQPRMLGSVGFLMATAPTLAHAYRALNDYLPLLMDGLHLSLRQDETGAALLLDLQDDHDRPLAEWLLACLHNWPRWLIGKQMPLRQVDLAFPAPDSPTLYQQFFAAEVRFDADRNRLHFDARVLQQPCLDANEELHRHHLQFADQLLSTAGRDGALVAQVKSLIRNQLAGGDTAITRDRVAQALNLSLRTLQRKLDQQETHFQALFDETRRELALQLIHAGERSFGEIGYQLGFSGLSAFQKAFKRWTGQAPGRYRASLSQPSLTLPAHRPRSLQERISQERLDETAFYPLAQQLVVRLRRRPPGLPAPLLHPARVSLGTDAGDQLRLALDETDPDLLLPPAEVFVYTAPEGNGLLPEGGDAPRRLYELGCLFYFMLHGRAPHRAADPAALLRTQLQQTPTVTQALSPALRAILVKLLSLEPNSRYQSFEGLAQDLQQARLLRENGAGKADFVAGRQDTPPLQMQPERLCGRQPQQQYLAEQLQRSRRNEGRLLLLEGPPGSGKSALIDGLVTPVFRSQGSLVRFDLGPDTVDPLAALITPVRRFLRHKLAAPPARRELWAQQVQRDLGPQLPVLGRHLPELALFTGPLEAAPGGEPISLVEGLCELLSQQRDPLVVVFDDLHRSGSDGLQLLQGLLERLGAQPLLLIATYVSPERSSDSPDSPGHRLLPLLTGHRRSRHLALAPLSRGDVHELLGQLLGGLGTAARLLGERLYQLSGGNPGRLHAELERLQADGKLRPAADGAHWQWLPAPPTQTQPPELIRALNAALHRLPPASIELLRWGAAIGERFSLSLLAAARQDPQPRIAIHLWPAEQAGILHPGAEALGEGRFSHPGLCRQLLAPLDRQRRSDIHRRIGHALLARAQHEPERLEEAVTQLARAQRLNPQPEQRLPLAEAHRDAARQALTVAERPRALAHYRDALALLQPADARTREALCATLWSEGIHRLLDQGAREEAAHWLDLLDSAALPLSRGSLATFYPLARSRLRRQQDDGEGACRELIDALAARGIVIDPTLPPLVQRLYEQLAPTAASPLDAPLDAPLETTADDDALLDALQGLAEHRRRPELLLATLHAKARHSPAQAPVARQVLRQHLLAEASAASPLEAAPPAALWLAGARLHPWQAPLGTCIDTLEKALQNSRRPDFDQAPELSAELLLPLFNSRWIGDTPLPQIAEDLEIERGCLPPCAESSARRLRASAGHLLHALTTTSFEGEQGAPAPEDEWALLGDVCVSYLTERRLRWPALIEASLARAPRLSGLLAEAQLLLFTALMAAELARHASHRDRQNWLRVVEQQQLRFSLWARPQTPLFSAAAALLQAEAAALHDQTPQAIEAYEAAVAGADAAASLLLAGLSRQRFARFWQHRGQPTLADLLHGAAQESYRRWGATRLLMPGPTPAGLTRQGG